MRNLSATFTAAAQALQTDEIFHVLLTLEHADLTAPIRVVNNYEDVTSNGNTFTGYPFVITLPDDPESGVSVGKITIDNVSQTIIQSIRAISTPPEVTIQIVLQSDPDVVEVEYADFKLRNVTYDAYTISGDVAMDIFEQELFPRYSYTPSKFPGIFR